MGRSRVKAFENGVDLQYYKPAADFAPLKVTERGQGPLLVFTGQMDYRPNVEAVESFARRSFPQIRNRHANARFAIVGRNPAPAVRALAALPGVVVAGRSEEHTSELQSLMRISYAVFCLKKKKSIRKPHHT